MTSLADLDPRLFQGSGALHRVLDLAPYHPRCSHNKTAGRSRPRAVALRYPYMQCNPDVAVVWLIFDLDHFNSGIWESAGLPPPNLVVRDPNSGKSHLYYAIVPVCTSDAGRAKPIAYMKAVVKAYKQALCADEEYGGGPVSKTPGHPWWETIVLHDHEYDLGELASYVELERPTPWAKRKSKTGNRQSRHCLLFDDVRYFAYSIVQQERQNGSFEAFKEKVTAAAIRANDFASRGFKEGNLLFSSIQSTVKSITGWTWTKYHGNASCHRGAMNLDPALPLRERQHRAAVRTHNKRKESTAARVLAACQALLADGKRLAQGEIARLAGLARQTVARYQEIIDSAVAPAAARVEPAAHAGVDVTFGVHQMSAAFLGSLAGVSAGGVFDEDVPLVVCPDRDPRPG